MLTYTDISTFFSHQFPVIDEWLQIEGDTLRLLDNGADLYQHTYVRARQ